MSAYTLSRFRLKLPTISCGECARCSVHDQPGWVIGDSDLHQHGGDIFAEIPTEQLLCCKIIKSCLHRRLFLQFADDQLKSVEGLVFTAVMLDNHPNRLPEEFRFPVDRIKDHPLPPPKNGLFS